MTRTIVRTGLPLIGGALLTLTFFACSSDKSSDTGNDAGGNAGSSGSSGAGTGASSGSGGASGAGGSAGKSGSGGAAGGTAGGGGAAGADQYVCDKAPPRDPGGTAKEGDPCCKTSDGTNVGKCVKTSSITDPLLKAAYGHDTCTASTTAASDLKCEPTDAAMSDAGALGAYETCKATFGGSLALEGRCLPKCFVAGMPAAVNLAQETCLTKDLVCAPCYSPIDASDTGACSQAAGDKPKEPKPATFKKCGAIKAGTPDLGICVPEALVTDPVQKMALQTAFAGDAGVVDLCDTGEVCAPSIKAMDTSACFKHCASIAGPGACIPTYLVPPAQRTLLASMTDVCDKASEMCAPCLNPLSMPANQPTGACN